MSKASKRTQDTDAELPTPSATDLMVLIENGETDEALRSVEALNQRDFVQVWRAVQLLEKALAKYALSWQGAEYWGNGTPFPDEQEALPEAA